MMNLLKLVNLGLYSSSSVVYRWLIGVMLQKLVFLSLPDVVVEQVKSLEQEGGNGFLSSIFLEDVSMEVVLGILVATTAIYSVCETVAAYFARLDAERFTQDLRRQIVEVAFKFTDREANAGHDDALIRDLILRRLEIVKDFKAHYGYKKGLFVSSILGFVVFALVISYRYGLLAVGLLVVTIILTFFMDDFATRDMRRKAQGIMAQVNSHTLDVLRTADSVSLNNMETVESQKLVALHANHFKSTISIVRLLCTREVVTFVILGFVPVVCGTLAYSDMLQTTSASDRFDIAFTLLTFFLFMDETHKRIMALEFVAMKELGFNESMNAIQAFIKSAAPSDEDESEFSDNQPSNTKQPKSLSMVVVEDDPAACDNANSLDQVAQPTGTTSFVANNIVVQYDDEAKPVLEDLSFSLKPGIYGIIGESGCGKSTLMGLIAGFVRPKYGNAQVKFQQENIMVSIGKDTIREVRNHLGYVSQDSRLFARTILQNVTYGASEDEPISETRLKRALQLAEIEDWVASLPNGVETFLPTGGEKEVSGGQRQRLQLARLFYRKTRPDIILLDECMSALDPECRLRMVNNLRNYLTNPEFGENPSTTIIVTHHYDILDICEEIFELEDHRKLVPSQKHQVV